MGQPVYVNLVVRGTVYADVAAAAQGEGVTPGAVRRAIAAGRLDRLGARKRRLRYDAMPVRIRGQTFTNAQAAADHFGVTTGAIYQALSRGKMDRVGLAPERGQARALPVVIGGMRFRSMAVASRALGFGSSYVSQAYTRNSTFAKQRILAAAMRLREQQDQAKRTDAVRLDAMNEKRIASC
ncbi:hypothetical protein [Antarcticimicrobium sediminis]|uniref:NUMOD1 domain-containing protein n=1 Tax=Antarcticimicrobium sediminis TaxID=2546227 RepID=A0A4R5EIJ1_9RHOB|nr:hypothetical protein [Antarcticimicrobium sediminis]TDE34143.1 hypothetical protein E1B25_20350 [Antarcticimicrobium sediminis]